MRTPLLVAVLCAAFPLLSVADQSEADLMREAQRAYIAGDYDTATQLFANVLASDPQNTVAIGFLREIRAAEAGQVTSPAKDPIQTLVIPSVQFNEATFSSCLDYLKQQAAAKSVDVSFVEQLPPSQLQTHVTLSLHSIPFLEALRYTCEFAHATYKVERYAIVILPAGSDSGSSVTSADSDTGSQPQPPPQ
jgi:hypothetical protein